jgi:hypothetical protein
VRQLSAGTFDWVEFELPTPVDLEPGEAPLWVTLRTTQGEVRWFGSATGDARISLDAGATWGAVDALLLAAPTAPLVQLFHALAEPLPRPKVRLQLGPALLSADLLAGAGRTSPREFAVDTLELPEAALNALATAAGTSRVDTVLELFSRAVADVTLTGAALSYDPFGA